MKLVRLLEQITNRPPYATDDDIRKAFGDYHNVLHWLARFLVGDRKVADTCIVDACTIAKDQAALFHEWLIHWAARATVGCALQLQKVQVSQQAVTYESCEPPKHGFSPLSREDFTRLIDHAEELRERLDVLARFVLVLCGIGRDPSDKVAVQLGVNEKIVQRAYLAGLDALRTAESPC